ncbi:MAG: hypothetical protein IJ786_05315 [Bacteroidaceae bacterium]|nr:hypothetical protein [Bacteroidaceae bacterium]
MKNYLKYTLTLVATALLMSACTDEYEYTPAEAYKGLYIATEQTNVTFQPTDREKTIVVKVVRPNAGAAQTVHFQEVTVSDENAFEGIPESVTFEKGETETEFTVTCNIEPGEDATLEISLPENTYDILYFSGTLKISAKVEFVWEEAGKAIYRSSVFGFEDEVKVMHPQGTNRYVLKDVIVEGYDLEFYLDDDYNALSWPNLQATGYEYGDYGMVYFFHNPASGYTFTNEGNFFRFVTVPVVVYGEGLAAIDDASYESFEWIEGYPGELE